MNAPRVRFAPSPTGFLHVGGARAALFNWLFARHTGGTFILRIEDTDEARSRPELIEAILGPLRTLGLLWDEGPYFQSERGALYAAAIDRLLTDGRAYFCSCSQDDVKTRREDRADNSGYDRFCRDRALGDGPGRVVRFAVPDDGVTVVDDVVRGRVEFAHADLEDFVVRRSDGSPVFLVANAVDDMDMAITHAVRGEDLLNTTPKVVLIMGALGCTAPPVYAHLPLLVNAQRKKLSKRRDDVALGDYLDRGYLPEALLNYLATLGWGAPDGVEIRPLSEIVALFHLEDVNKASAFFDGAKLDHFNQTYIRDLPVDEFLARAQPFVSAPWRPDVFEAVATDVQQRVTRLDEIPAMVDWIMGPGPAPAAEAWTKVMAKGKLVPEILAAVVERLRACEWTAEAVHDVVLGVGDELGAKSQVPVRLAVTGRQFGLPLFTSIVHLDRAEVVRRIEAALVRLRTEG